MTCTNGDAELKDTDEVTLCVVGTTLVLIITGDDGLDSREDVIIEDNDSILTDKVIFVGVMVICSCTLVECLTPVEVAMNAMLLLGRVSEVEDVTISDVNATVE